ncbi:MAG: hypothetical protein QOE83_33 [Actinomycetota bacterium]|jgi:hypothetical protein|nr:hypothetical protein [Actinomycetota bacterium]
MPDTTKRPQVIDKELADQLMNYKGRWVAVDKGRVVADGDSATDAVEAAKGVGVTDPLVFRVSAHPERLSLL